MPRHPSQTDLFDAPLTEAVAAVPALPPAIEPAALDDDSLLDAVRGARPGNAQALVDELIRRQLPGAAAALEALCRRFKGFGATAALPEQTAALAGLRRMVARAAIERLIVDHAVIGPGLVNAVEAAAAVQVRLPPDTALSLLRHDNPRLRAAACGCARLTAETAPVVVDLLADLHDTVADAAALALALAGRSEARPRLMARLLRDPSAEFIEAFALIADDDGIVLLGRLADRRSALVPAVLAALDAMDVERAASVARGIRRRMPH